MTWFILALFAARLQRYAGYAKRSFRNGIKTVQYTLDKKPNLEAPMRYKVLLPYLAKLLPRHWSMEDKYEIWRVILLWLACLSVAHVWGNFVAAVWLLLAMSAQIYDTWCYTGEVIGVSMALTGNPVLAIGGIVLHGMSRETVLLNGFVYYLATGNAREGLFLTVIALSVFWIVRLYQGIKPLYCDRFMIRQNIQMLFSRPKEPFVFYAPHMNLIIIALALFGAYWSGNIGWYVPALICGTITMGKINEYRLHIAIMPWVALALERLL